MLFIQFAKRTVRVSKEMTEDAKTLLRLMGVPVIEAPTEAEAQCAALARAGVVHAAVSEDMDTLTFGAPVMLRNVFGKREFHLIACLLAPFVVRLCGGMLHSL
jgi:flap endonuclease-1